MLRFLILAAAVVFAAGCQNLHTVPAATGGATAEELISGLSPTDYSETKRCLSTLQYDSVEVIGDRYLLFKGRGDDLWINELATPCPSLKSYDTLAFDLRSSQACRLDSVSGVNRFLFTWQRGPTCALGDFKKVNEAQAAQLKAALND